MSGEIAKIPTPDSSQDQIIDAEFEVKSGPTKTGADPVRISPEEQAKLNATLEAAGKKQAEQDAADLRRAQEKLQKAFERQFASAAGVGTKETPNSDLNNSKGALTEREQVWISELRSKIKEQKKLIEKDRAILKKAQEEYKSLGAKKQPWYTIFTDPFGIYHSDELRDKRGEVEERKRHLEQLRIYLEELESDLEKAIKGSEA